MVAHVGTNNGFGDSAAVTVPSGTTGDLLVCFGIGWPRSGGAAANPFIDGNATRDAAFTNVTQISGPNAGPINDKSTVDLDRRTTDGTEPASYTISLDQQENNYGGAIGLTRIEASQLQTTSGGIYTSSGSGAHTFPAHTVDSNNSIVVVGILGWGSAPNNSTITGQGYTSRVSEDSGWIRLYTKEVNAGSVSSFTAGTDGNTTATVLLVFEPVAAAVPPFPLPNLHRHRTRSILAQ